jgi:hypothetical protein
MSVEQIIEKNKDQLVDIHDTRKENTIDELETVEIATEQVEMEATELHHDSTTAIIDATEDGFEINEPIEENIEYAQELTEATNEEPVQEIKDEVVHQEAVKEALEQHSKIDTPFETSPAQTETVAVNAAEEQESADNASESPMVKEKSTPQLALNEKPIESELSAVNQIKAILSKEKNLNIVERFNISRPLSRNSSGPALATSAITSSVGRVNPILDEVLYALNAIRENDPEVTTFDVKNYALTNKQGLALAIALKDNMHVTRLNLSNAGIQNNVAVELARVLKSNSSVTHVNLEQNQIGPQGMREFAFCLQQNSAIVELKLGYQNSITSTGQEAERAFAESIQKNKTLLKLGLAFRNAACRDQADRSITRNKELARKARLSIAK